MEFLNEIGGGAHDVKHPIGHERQYETDAYRNSLENLTYYGNHPSHGVNAFAGSVTLLSDDIRLKEYAEPEEGDIVLHGKTAFLAAPAGDLNYFHWMIDVLARAGRLDALESYEHIVINTLNYPFQFATFPLIGFKGKVHTANYDVSFFSEEMHVPSLRRVGHRIPADWMVNFLREQILPYRAPHSPLGDKIFITRLKRGVRTLTNMAEVSTLLRREGFQEVVLEDYNFLEQVSIIHSATMIIAPHGAGLTNTAFCRRGAKILELFSPHYISSLFYFISAFAGADYYFLVGEEEEFDPNRNANSQDIRISVAVIEAMIKKILS
ncbi:glycosyltransferase family 61 protein [Eilatimonas milleporae]|uniref:Uncharacterized protein DUF563 n=1 Tax=Eilatimonas milleporae TaxID=911205 RepID=A0A3M0CVQ5_9PROT|nr:glycosyltransferase family 61 protein [Eilatimonas milleporae]RMB12640.1 uncharacterized protein DUF563 [Eilatimonas milleporae]